MRMVSFSRVVAGALAVALSTSCALILHPERKGNAGLPLDTVPLVVDILLFLPGLVPGIVALALDFGTGAIYLNKGAASKPVLGATDRRQAQRLDVRIVDEDGTVLKARTLTVEPPRGAAEPIAITLDDLDASRWQGRDVRVEITAAAGDPIVLAAAD